MCAYDVHKKFSLQYTKPPIAQYDKPTLISHTAYRFYLYIGLLTFTFVHADYSKGLRTIEEREIKVDFLGFWKFHNKFRLNSSSYEITLRGVKGSL